MRWLVMFPQVNLGGFKTVRQHFSAVASQPDMGLAWISGPLAGVLERAAAGMLSAEPPFVLMTLRGRAYMRMQLATPDAAVVDDALSLFETAVTQALRLAGNKADAAPEWPSAATTEWQSLDPGDPPELPPRA